MSRARPPRHARPGASRAPRHPGTRAPSPAGVAAARAWLLPLLPLLAALAGVAWFLHREWLIAGLWGFSLDDSWIHAVFARNIATGKGYSFNPGEPVSGSTGPLYSILLGAAHALTGEMIGTAKVIGVACHLVSVVQIYRAARHLDPGHAWVPLAAATLVATSPLLLWASLSGMEISFYVALLCSGLERYLAGRDVAAILFWSLGVWVRPDGLFLVVLGMLGPTRTLWKRAAVAASVILPFFAFNAIVGGSILPQTVAAKSHFGFDLAGRTWKLAREWAAIWGVPFRRGDELEHPILLLPFLLVGIVLLARKKPVLALYAIGLPIAFSLFRDNSSSHKRYILHVIPFGILLAVAGMQWLASRFAPRRRADAAFLALSLACLVWQAAIANAKGTTHGWNVQNINMMQRLLAETTRHATVPEAVVAASDIGAIAYFSQRKVVDLMGLVSAPRTLPQNLTHHRPDVLIVMVDWFKEYARRDSTTNFFAFYDEDSTHKYTPIFAVELSHNTICAGDQMVAFVRQRPGDPPPPLNFRRF